MSADLAFGPFRFDPETGVLKRDGRNVPLPPRAQALLEHLLKHSGRLVTKDELLDSVWPGVHVTDTSLKEAVHVLRQSLGDDPRSPAFLETLPRRGYRFVGAVEHSEAPRGGQMPRFGWWLGAATLGLILAILLGPRWRSTEPRPSTVPHRFEIRLPDDHVVTPGPPNLALSPDGRLLAYTAKSQGERRLFLRPVNQLEATALTGTEGAGSPFFSPDGQWIGFFTGDALKRIAVTGGGVETLCDVRRGLSADWGSRGIVMSVLEARDRAGLWQVPSAGGRPRVLTTLGDGETAHRWPEILSDHAIMFTVWRSGFEDADTVVLDLESGQRSTLLEGSNARYAPPHQLVFAREGRLWAVPFDPRRHLLNGEETPILEDVAMTPVFGTAHFAVAPAGALVFMPRIDPPPPVLVRRRGSQETGRSAIAVSGTVADLRLSPDEQRLSMVSAGDAGLDLWVLDLDRHSLARRPTDGTGLNAVWSPDSHWLLSASTADGLHALVRFDADGGGRTERLWTDEVPLVATSWSPDGRRATFSRLDPEGGWDLWILRLGEWPADVPKAEPWLSTPYDETRGAFSPDGRFLAYESDETGRREIYVRAFPVPGARWPISTEGGSHPQWSRDGRHIWFRRGQRVFVTAVQFEPVVEIGRPEPRFESAGLPGYSVAVGGDEVLYLERPEAPSAPTSLRFLVNWLAEPESSN